MSYMPKSKSDVHITPQRVYDMIFERWHMRKHELFDPCPVNPEFDGLETDWNKFNYVNPPYPLLKEFVYKAVDEAANNNTSIMLLPSKTDQAWFHDISFWHRNIIWIRGRLKFEGAKWNATQPHFLVMIN